jgi:hypothetical protein
MGGPTTEQLGVNNHWSGWTVTIEGLLIVGLPANPTLACVDFSRTNIGAEGLDAVSGGNIAGTQPTNANAFGIWLPVGGNAGIAKCGDLDFFGVYAAVIGNPHMSIDRASAQSCVLGLGLIGNEQVNTNDGHSSIVSYLLTQECVYHIASYSPSSGAISLPSGKPVQLRVPLWDIEDWATGVAPGSWSTTVNHILDANNELYGAIQYARVLAIAGPASGLTSVGAETVGLTRSHGASDSALHRLSGGGYDCVTG